MPLLSFQGQLVSQVEQLPIDLADSVDRLFLLGLGLLALLESSIDLILLALDLSFQDFDLVSLIVYLHVGLV